MKTFLLSLAVTGLVSATQSLAGADSSSRAISLAGTWRFQLDRTDAGMHERWFTRRLPERIRLPGALQNQGFGDDITPQTKWTGDVGADRWLRGAAYEPYRQPGQVKVPFFLQPEKHYVGVAWYQREFEVPKAWAGQRIRLLLERPHWETRVWIDDRLIGTNDSLSTPHQYDLGIQLAPGKHRVTIRVDNRMIVDVGAWSHSVSDHTQGNWNGVVGRIELTATPLVWIEQLDVIPQLAQNRVLVKGQLGNATGQAGSGQLELAITSLEIAHTQAVAWGVTGGTFEVSLTLNKPVSLWDEFTPALHRIEARLGSHQHSVSFGLREFTTTPDRLIAINGRPLFLRGTLECCIFPLTGYPPTDVPAWKRIIRICQAHGLNHIRFHSWCPPEAAFIAADELGFYYHVECAAWTEVGSGKPQDAWLYREAQRILEAYGNHPSFAFLAYGNEPNGTRHQAWLSEWVNHWKQQDPRRLHTSGAGWPQLPENQYHVWHGPRGPNGWRGRDYRDVTAKVAGPVIVHEMGQWCVYPNFDEMRKYTGPLKPKNFEIFRDSLANHGMLGQWRDFFHASGRLQALGYKEEIEAAMRTPGVAGIQLLDLHDFPGQGTALVGVLDPFWDSKGYITPDAFRRFFGQTVPLARLLKRTWTTTETLRAEVEAVHFGAQPWEQAVPYWEVKDKSGAAVAQGTWPVRSLPIGRGLELGKLALALDGLPAPAAYTVVVGLRSAEARPTREPHRSPRDAASHAPRATASPAQVENDWTIWVYPSDPPHTLTNVLFSATLDETVLNTLATGGRVLLATTRLSTAHPRLTFEPIFWNRYMFNTQQRYTLGLLCQPLHPALAQFPTDTWQDWQWHDIVTHARGVVLDDSPRALRPIVQPIDDWNTNRKLGLLFEARVGSGRLLVCAADLSTKMEERPAARQLLSSLLEYAQSAKFNPPVTLSTNDLLRLFQGTTASTLVKLGAKVLHADSADREHGNLPENAVDGDPDTFWHTRWQPRNDPMPHTLTLDLGKPVKLTSVTYLPRQDMANGRIARAEIFCSLTPEQWGKPVAAPHWTNTAEWQPISFAESVVARFLKLVIQSEVNGHPFAAIAELDVTVSP